MTEPIKERTLSRLDRSDETRFDELKVNDIVRVVLNKKESGIDHLIGKIYRIEEFAGRLNNNVVHILLRNLPQSLTPILGPAKLTYFYFNYKDEYNRDVYTDNEYRVFEGCVPRNQIMNRRDLLATKLIKIDEESEDRLGEVPEATKVGPLDLNGNMHQIAELGSVITQPSKLKNGHMYYVKLYYNTMTPDGLIEYLKGKGYIAQCRLDSEWMILTPLYYRCEKTCDIGPWMKFSNDISEELIKKSQQRWRQRNLLDLPIISSHGNNTYNDIFIKDNVFIVELNNDIKVSKNVSPDEATELLKEWFKAASLALNSREIPPLDYFIRKHIASYLGPDRGGNKKRNKTHKKQKKLRRKNTRNR
jgi:hypothetical protein